MTLGYFDFISYSISKIKIWLRIYEYRTWLINRKAKKQKEHMRKARNYRIEKKSEIVLMVKMFRKEIVWVTIETNTFNSFGLVGLKLPKHNDCFFTTKQLVPIENLSIPNTCMYFFRPIAVHLLIKFTLAIAGKTCWQYTVLCIADNHLIGAWQVSFSEISTWFD